MLGNLPNAGHVGIDRGNWKRAFLGLTGRYARLIMGNQRLPGWRELKPGRTPVDRGPLDLASPGKQGHGPASFANHNHQQEREPPVMNG